MFSLTLLWSPRFEEGSELGSGEAVCKETYDGSFTQSNVNKIRDLVLLVFKQ